MKLQSVKVEKYPCSRYLLNAVGNGSFMCFNLFAMFSIAFVFGATLHPDDDVHVYCVLDLWCAICTPSLRQLPVKEYLSKMLWNKLTSVGQICFREP